MSYFINSLIIIIYLKFLFLFQDFMNLELLIVLLFNFINEHEFSNLIESVYLTVLF